MTAEALFWLTVAPALAALVAALVLDAIDGSSSLAALAPASLLAAAGLVAVVGGWGADPQPVAGAFVVGGGRSVVSGAVLLLSALVMCSDDPQGRRPAESSLMAIAGIGGAIAVMSGDLLSLLLALEVTALASYGLVALGSTRASRAAAMRYFVQGSIASGLFVMALAASAASLAGIPVPSRLAIPAGDPRAVAFMAIIALIALALALKAGAAPLHLWVPGAYASAGPRGAALLAGAVKVGVIGALAAIVASVDVAGWLGSPAGPAPAGALAAVLALSAVASLIIGAVGALGERSYRRMLALAGVSQAGYALLALAGGDATSAVVHTTLYGVAAAGVFGAAGGIGRVRPSWDGAIDTLAGVGRERPVLGAGMAVLLASLAGLPPFAGFWGKVLTISVPVRAALRLTADGPWWVLWACAALALVALVASVVSMAYYGAVMRTLFATQAEPTVHRHRDEAGPGRTEGTRSFAAEAVVTVAAVVVTVLGLMPLVTGVARAFAGFALIR